MIDADLVVQAVPTFKYLNWAEPAEPLVRTRNHHLAIFLTLMFKTDRLEFDLNRILLTGAVVFRVSTLD